VTARPILFAAAIALQACYSSWDRGGGDDASTDPGVEDAVMDSSSDPDAEADGWRFIDRDDPDHNIAVDLLFAAVCDIAWNGTSVGLVYHGMESGAGERVGFIPLDARGRSTGGERRILDGAGLASAMPRISSAGDGSFLVNVLQESGGDRIVVLRLAADGDMLSMGTTPDWDNIVDPLCAPVRVDDRVYVVTESYGAGEESNVGFMFSYPDLDFIASTRFLPTGECWGGDPLLMKDPVSTDLMLLHRCIPMENVVVEWLDPDMVPRGATTVFGHAPVSAYHASSSAGGWMGYGFEQRIDATSLQLWQFEPGGGLWLAPDIEATFYSALMDSDHAQYPASSGVFALYHDESWQVWARLNASPPGWGWVDSLMIVNDAVEARTFEDMPMPAVAWTGGGFLVVWDEWRMDTTYSLFSSFIELVPVY